ncbi:MAG: hypothetical protein JWP34_4520 [Massilia sp.]|nr:hypothetical protein [Massilia sp.]
MRICPFQSHLYMSLNEAHRLHSTNTHFLSTIPVQSRSTAFMGPSAAAKMHGLAQGTSSTFLEQALWVTTSTEMASRHIFLGSFSEHTLSLRGGGIDVGLYHNGAISTGALPSGSHLAFLRSKSTALSS